MKSILDDARSWILTKQVLAGRLDIYLIELKRGPPQSVLRGGSMENLHPLEPDEKSLRVKVTFEDILSWQCVTESACNGFSEEIRESEGFISVLSSSRYLAYVLANHGWYADVREAAVKHYRVWSENDVFDVVAFAPPVVVDLSDESDVLQSES